MDSLIELKAEQKAIIEVMGKATRKTVWDLTEAQQKQFWILRKKYFEATFEKATRPQKPQPKTDEKPGVQVIIYRKLKKKQRPHDFTGRPKCSGCEKPYQPPAYLTEVISDDFCDGCLVLVNKQLEEHFEFIEISLKPKLNGKKIVTGQKASYKVR